MLDFTKPNLRGYSWTEPFEKVMIRMLVKMRSLRRVRDFWYDKFRQDELVNSRGREGESRGRAHKRIKNYDNRKR